jgi:4-hydroxy-tetrahydrodipicolinate synthase
MKETLGTILTAMVTPFDERLAVDFERLVALAAHLFENGSDGVVVAGTTGESPTLSDDEKVEMFAAVVAAAHGRGTVVAGTGSNDTAHTVELTRRAETAGVDAVLVVTPYYNKPPERGLLLHFRTVAAATSLPLIIYNIPSRCVVNLSPQALAELAKVDNIIGVKQANPDLAESRTLREISDLGLYAGNDDMLLDVVAMGGLGGICVASHLVGAQMKAIVNAVHAGDIAGAQAIDERLTGLYEALSMTTNPILVKAAMTLLGHKVGGLRPPLVAATADETQAIAAELRRQGILS